MCQILTIKKIEKHFKNLKEYAMRPTYIQQCKNDLLCGLTVQQTTVTMAGHIAHTESMPLEKHWIYFFAGYITTLYIEEGIVRLDQLDGAGVYNLMTVGETAEHFGYCRSMWSKLMKVGIMPRPKKPENGRAHYDQELLDVCKKVIKTRIGINGKMYFAYKKRAKHE